MQGELDEDHVHEHDAEEQVEQKLRAEEGEKADPQTTLRLIAIVNPGFLISRWKVWRNRKWWRLGNLNRPGSDA